MDSDIMADDIFLQRLAKMIGKHWKVIGSYLGLDNAELEQLNLNALGNQQEVNFQMLKRWIQKQGNKATSFLLAKKLREAEYCDMADWVQNCRRERVEPKDYNIVCESIRWKDKVSNVRDRSECKKVGCIHFNRNFDISGQQRGTSVFLGIFKNKAVAVKRVQHKDVEQEVEIFQTMKEKSLPHVLEILCVEMDEDFTYIVSELCECDLKCVIENKECPLRKSLTTDKRVEMCIQLIEGIQNLHDFGIIHRDLKPPNILVDKYLGIRIADFGKSRELSMCDTTVHTKRAGTWGWTPTEYFHENTSKRSKKAGDVQVAGFLAFYILSDGHHPFESINPYHKDLVKLAANIKEGNFTIDLIKGRYPEKSLNILREMLHCNFEERPSLMRCRLHFQVPTVPPFEKFLAIFSTYLTTSLTKELCEAFELDDGATHKIITAPVPGYTFLRILVGRGTIKSDNVENLKKAMEKKRMVQAVVKIDDYITQVEQHERTSLELKPSRTIADTLSFCIDHLRQKLRVWYNSICPIPWKKTFERHLKELFTDNGLFEKTPNSKFEQFQVDERCRLQYFEPLTEHKKVQYLIVEGDSGSGKTLLTAQLAYDWCQGKFPDIDIFIPLPLKLVENMTLAEAVKELWFHDVNFICKEDIEKFLQRGRRCFMLDGVDEYIGRDQSDCYLSRVKELMQGVGDTQCQVIATVRPGHINEKSDAIFFRMGKLVDSKRHRYIEKAFPGEIDKQEKMLRSIENHPILRHICTVPMLFILTIQSLQNLSTKDFDGPSQSVTRFMELIMRNFCPYLSTQESEGTMTAIAKIAFQGLCRRKQRLLWRKEFFERNVGDVREIIDSGILVVEEELPFTNFLSDDSTMDSQKKLNRVRENQNESERKDPVLFKKKKMEMQKISANPGNLSHVSDDQAEKNQFPKVPLHVRFLHNIIQEWFAASYLSSVIASGNKEDIRRHLELVDEKNLQYLLRFVCGMCGSNHHYIFDHLIQKIIQTPAQASMILNCIALCLVEVTSYRDIIPRLGKIISNYTILIKGDEDEILQIAKVELLKMAVKQQIVIHNLTLVDVLMDVTNHGLQLRCGASISGLGNVEKCQIHQWSPSWSQDNDRNNELIVFLLQDNLVREVELHFPSPPPTLTGKTLSVFTGRKVKVTWTIGAKTNHLLDPRSGIWLLKETV